MTTSPELTIPTPSGPVFATAQDHQDGRAVLYTLRGAVRGQVCVTGTHDRYHWDQFTALRVSFGSCDVMAELAPQESLPHLRSATTRYVGSVIRSTGEGEPYQQVQSLESTAGREPSEKTAQTLTAVLHACGEDTACRPDLPRLLDAAREGDTPALLRFLTSVLTQCEKDAARYEKEAAEHLRDGRAAAALWWALARQLTAAYAPLPVLAWWLADYTGSQARRALVAPDLARISQQAAANQRQDHARFTAEVASLRAQQRTRRPRWTTPAAERR
ncbi:hypothetical protein GCM10010358_68090 [Streptomyces minutiscleroticus]|uniref:Uncharacterized protein n=1 Tax=Streptomyces minutiscleroticus TaxID=68238 RepID=A0A918NXV6_9ACTN|nr:hypothetical protein [Streptomyces minutiscleroticus]GGY05091.1 hypothetical protein GCM10010358_68090 [Streptomyces minutiscleroticus]